MDKMMLDITGMSLIVNDISGRHVSIHTPFRSGENICLLDVIENNHQPSPDSDLIDKFLKVEIERTLATLTKREAEVLRRLRHIPGSKTLQTFLD